MNNAKKYALVMLTSCLLLYCERITEKGGKMSIVPKPTKMEFAEGGFALTPSATIEIEQDATGIREVAEYLRNIVAEMTDVAPPIVLRDVSDTAKRAILLRLTDDEGDLGIEGYTLRVAADSILLAARAPAGLFYGVQTFRQLLFQAAVERADQAITIPCLTIEDTPRYRWRGMMLDVSRHFFDVTFVKDFIDYLAMHKLNTFHWHLVDDQGWRVQIKKYPRLTEAGAWRVDREHLHWNAREAQNPGESATYGGFYTQEQIKEVVEYAQSRFITVVPEIEMPAHVTAALTAYPELSCTGGPFTVPPGGVWPITDIYCAGNDAVFEFLENVLKEVMELFPGTYIHIGGDEATKTEWEKCPKCQARIRAEGLEDEHELQSYFIRRIEKYLLAHGRRLIGWDEILEGGLAPEATVMSWRGMQGGIEAAKAGHDVVMSPTTHCYFDYYQGDPKTEPLAIGGYLPLSTVYEFEPTPKELNAAQAKHILGGQANLWTEYIPNPRHAQYMIFPRIAALAEVVWTSRKTRNWRDFSGRLMPMLDFYRSQNINYARSCFQITSKVNFDDKSHTLEISLETELPQLHIYYSTDGTDPSVSAQRYRTPLRITETSTIRAEAYLGERAVGPQFEEFFRIHKAAGKTVTLSAPYSSKYAGGGDTGLTNSIRGTKDYRDGKWQGFEGVDFEAVVDLGETTSVQRIEVGFLQHIGGWIFLPETVEFAVSEDGENFESVGVSVNELSQKESARTIKQFAQEFPAKPARYVKVFAKNIGALPDWFADVEGKAWIFVDEIVVE